MKPTYKIGDSVIANPVGAPVSDFCAIIIDIIEVNEVNEVNDRGALYITDQKDRGAHYIVKDQDDDVWQCTVNEIELAD